MPIRKLSSVIALLAAGLCSTLASRADTCNGFTNNLVSNCSFETGSFSSWTGTSTTSIYSGVDALSPYVGRYEAYLGSIGSTSALTQTLTTTAGGLYLIEFALLNDTSPSTGYLNSFSLLFGGNALFSESAVAAGGYTLYSFWGTAGSNSTDLSFVSRNDGGDFDLDSISVVRTTPEPGSWMLLGTGALSVGAAIRKRFVR